jgi:hypothetical protein
MVPTIVKNSRGCWVSGLRPLSGILQNTVFWKLGLFPSSGEGWEASDLCGPLETDDLSHNPPVLEVNSFWWTQQIRFPKRRVLLYYETMDKVEKLSNSNEISWLTERQSASQALFIVELLNTEFCSFNITVQLMSFVDTKYQKHWHITAKKRCVCVCVCDINNLQYSPIIL